MFVLYALVASIVITPGAVPVVQTIHPDETAWIEEIKESLPEEPPVVLAHTHYTPPVPTISYSVEQWRPLVEKYFAAEDIPWAMRVMQCESGGNPNAKNSRSSASGLFQQLATYWPQRSVWYGWEGYSVFDPEANIAVSAGLFYDGGPGHWVCK